MRPGISALAFSGLLLAASDLAAAQPGPTMLHRKLAVRTLVGGLQLPTSFAFIGPDDLLVLEKNTGQVLRVAQGSVVGPVLDLSVNGASERGLLGIALHPEFPRQPKVFLFWSCRTAGAPADPFVPDETACPSTPALGPDTEDVLFVPLLANRVDRFHWNGSSLAFERNLITLRAFQNDAAPTPPGQGDEAQIARGNHDGGVLRFGPEGNLYVLLGDVGRRGQLQNLPSGPTPNGLGPTMADDQFGGPEPDDAHLAGVILRLEPDGSAPRDNPFFAHGARIGGDVGENLQRIFAYGLRNSFGMAFDPIRGDLWCQENGEDAFDEINRVEPGMNGGWIQIAGPLERLSEYRSIETTSLHHDDFPNLQQFRWGPERIATTPVDALSRLFVLPGSHYSDPEFSWKYVLAPAGIGFVAGRGLGRQFAGDLFVGFSVPDPEGGPLFRFQLTGNRRRIAVDDPRLQDRVADNPTFHDMGESERLLIGRDFGVVTDIQTGPNGNLFVASLSHGAIFEIFRARGRDDVNVDEDLDDLAEDSGVLPDFGSDPTTGLDFGVEADSETRQAIVRFALAEPSRVRLAVYDVAGHRVGETMDRELGAGTHVLRWSPAGGTAAVGVYFARIETVGIESGVRHSQSVKYVVMR